VVLHLLTNTDCRQKGTALETWTISSHNDDLLGSKAWVIEGIEFVCDHGNEN